MKHLNLGKKTAKIEKRTKTKPRPWTVFARYSVRRKESAKASRTTVARKQQSDGDSIALRPEVTILKQIISCCAT